MPTARSFASLATGAGPGDVLVVCKGTDGGPVARRAPRLGQRRQEQGFHPAPEPAKNQAEEGEADELISVNEALAEDCAYDSVQDAVFDAGNNDRIAIMPGRYLEPESRSKPVNDPTCNPSLLQKDASGDLTPSYAYQVTCPNDQNLIYVQGRALAGEPLEPPLSDRQGIPAQELGPCVRCNLQIEGTGVKPEDVILDGGTDYTGTGALAKPGGYAKHVVLRVDRADGFVGRNFPTRGALENGFYNEEADGIPARPDEVLLGCRLRPPQLHVRPQPGTELRRDSASGDAGVYPGAAPETGSQATDFYPDAPRTNTVVKKCDMRGSVLAYSGSMGNAVRITDNHIYGNTTGIYDRHALGRRPPRATRRTASQIDHNLHLLEQPRPLQPGPAYRAGFMLGPIGTGILFAGHNDGRGPRQLDLRQLAQRRDADRGPGRAVQGGGPEGDIVPGISCAGAPANGISTSCGNQFLRQPLGQAPKGSSFPERARPCSASCTARRRAEPQEHAAERQRLLVG